MSWLHRDATQQANDQMLRLLSESVRSTVASADRINQRLATLGAQAATPNPALTGARGSGVGAENSEGATGGQRRSPSGGTLRHSSPAGRLAWAL